MPPGLTTFWLVGTLLWALIAFLIVMVQPVGPIHGESVGLAVLLLFMFGPPLAVAVLLFARWRWFWRRG